MSLSFTPDRNRHLKFALAQPLYLACVVLLVVGLIGCDRGPRMVQVSGKVLLKDGSVPKGGVRVVRFEPVSGGDDQQQRPAGGTIADDGSFVMCTRVPGDGVICGEYNVTITVWRGPRDPVSLIDETYSRSATTPYQVSVEEDKNDLFFEVEPAGKKGAS